MRSDECSLVPKIRPGTPPASAKIATFADVIGSGIAADFHGDLRIAFAHRPARADARAIPDAQMNGDVPDRVGSITKSRDRLAVRTADFTVGFGLFVLAAGGGGLAYAIAKNKLRKRLLQQGVTCLGRVTSSTIAAGKSREDPGRSSGITIGPGRKEGSPVRVYYDATDSRVFTVDLGASD